MEGGEVEGGTDFSRYFLGTCFLRASLLLRDCTECTYVSVRSHLSVWQGACKKYSSQSRYQALALCEELSPARVQQVLLHHLSRPLPPLQPLSSEAAVAELSYEF